MSPLELFAALLGVISVALTVRQNVWCWPIGAAMVALYTFIFWRERLYADAGLQVVYFLLQFYGWYEWLRGGTGKTELPVSRTPRPQLWFLLTIAAMGSLVLGATLGRYTDQDFPYLDSTVTAFSLVAQWMMAKKLIENWLLWFAIDVLATGIYCAKHLYPTAILYTLFLGLAIAGFRQWRRDLVRI